VGLVVFFVPTFPDSTVVEVGIPTPWGVGTIGTSFNLSLVYAMKPAMGMLETFSNFTLAVSVAGGWYPETLTGVVVWGGVVLPFPNGLKVETKFVPGLLTLGTVAFRRKYKNPRITATATIKIIIKSIKFLLGIKIKIKDLV
jgi:hypothetical protein